MGRLNIRVAAIFLLIFLLGAAPGTVRAATQLEDLPYRVSLGAWEDAGRANLCLKELEPGRYQAEFSCAAQGFWSLLSRWLPESYRTEMVFRDGRLQPLSYREEFYCRGQKVVKEYRFNYQKGRLECWRQAGDRPSAKEWQVPLKEPVYDPLSLFYNLRLGTFGPLAGGETVKVQVIPTPDPEQIIISLGPESGENRKVMLSIREKSGHQRGPYFINIGQDGVPRTAWVRVLRFGKLTGKLLDPGRIMAPGRLRPEHPQIVGSQQPK